MGFRKGTGFTNINRILQANKGSKLGQTVSGGIGQQVQKVQSGVAGAKQEFEKKAEENRLDTDAAKQQREQTLNRFDAAPIAVDESKFAVSSGLQSDYEAKKGTASSFLKKEEDKLGQLKSKVLDFDQAKYDSLLSSAKAKNEASPAGGGSGGIFGGGNLGGGFEDAMEAMLMKQLWDRNNAGFQTQNKLDIAKSQEVLSGIGRDIEDVETDYTNRTAAEKAAYIDAEQRRIQQGLLPGEQEMGQFNKFLQGAYGGPTQLQDSDTLIAKAQQAESLGKLARTPGGSQELLKQFVGGRDYTSGQRKLDETILGQDKTNNLGSAVRQTRGLSRSVEDASRGASAKALEYSNRAKAFSDETKGLIEAKKTPLLSDIDKRISDIQTADQERSTKFDRIQNILGGKEFAGVDSTTRANIALDEAVKNNLITPEEMTKLSAPGGLIEQAKNLGIDPNQLLANKLQDKQAQNLSRSGVATGAENVRLEALNRLLGKQDYENEFTSGDRYQAGRTQLDLRGIEDHLRQTKMSDKNLKENVDYSDKDVKAFLDRIKPAAYDYKDEVKNSPLASKDRQLGVMAQDLEKSKLGKEAVSEGEEGKIVDYKDLQPKMLASLAALNQRLKRVEGKE